MGKLAERLGDASRSGVYRVSQDGEVLETLPAIQRISLAGAKSKAELLECIARALKLPDWFGQNWDALEDSLSERAGHLLFSDWQALATDDLGVLLDVLDTCAEFCAGRGRPFFAIFVDPERRLELEELFRDA
jgi:RNAse (barnase) inhibitor barstar